MNPLLRLTRLLRPHIWWMLLAALLGFATTGSGIGLLMTSAYIIAKAALQPPLASLQIAIAGVRFFGLARGLFRYAERLISHNVTFRILARLRLWFYDALEPLAPARLMHFRSADLLQRIVDDIQSLENIYTRVFGPPLTAIMISGLMWLLLGTWSPEAALLVLCFHALAGIGVPLLTRRMGKGLWSGIMQQKAEQQLLALDLVQGVAELQLFGHLPAHLHAMQQSEERKLALQRNNALIEGFHESLTGLLMNASLLTMLFVLAPGTTNGTSNGIGLAVITLAVIASFEPFLTLPTAIRHLEADKRAGERLFEIIDAKPETTPPASPTPFPDHHTIRLTKLGFTYPGNSHPALDNITLEIPHGSSIAIVGPSGAGKSTITALLMRFWNSREGNITINGIPITELDPETLRRNIALVAQRTYLFAETIRENLLLAAPDANDTELQEALRNAGLETFTDKLDEWCGQHGMKLSGGERQRLAIARVLLQKAPVMIFDEATANLDNLTETAVTNTLDAIGSNKTRITITHKLSRMERFDTIAVLEEGKIVQQGTHASLMQQEGLYRSMWELQNTPEV